MDDNDKFSSLSLHNQNIHLLSEFLNFCRPSKKATAASKFQDDQQTGGHIKETQKSQGSVLQKTEMPPTADISQVPI